MTPRAMCRIVMSALLLFGPLLTEWLSPAQVWGSALNTPPVAAKAAANSTNPSNELIKAASSTSNPGTDSQVIVNTPGGACNYITYTAASLLREGIYGSAHFSENPGADLFNNTQVVLINALNNAPLATTTIHSIPNTGQDFTFPDFSTGSSYSGITTIPNNLKFKLYFIPPAGDPHLPIYYPKAASISGAAVMRFNSEEAGNIRECLVRDDATGQLLTNDDGQGQSTSDIGPLLYRNGAIGGQLFIRNSGNPITSGVPISNAIVEVFTATLAIQDTPNTSVINSLTDINGNFMVDAYAGSNPLPAGKVFLRFTNGNNYQGYWLSNLSNPVDCELPCNPGIITPTQKLSLIRVIVDPSSSGYSQVYYPTNSQIPDGTPIIAQMVANNKILGKITTDGTNGAVNSYAVAYVNNTPVRQSDPVDASGLYTITKISNYVTYTVKFVTPIGTDYVGEWYNNKRVATNATADKLYTTVPGSPGDFTSIDAILTAGVTLSGKATIFGSSTGLGNVSVSVYSVDPNTGQSSIISNTTTDGSGNYSFTGLLDFGSYKIYFRDTSATYVAGWWDGGNPGNTVSTEAAAFTLTVGSLVGSQVANVALRPGNNIQGVVTLNPAPPAGFGSFPLRITVYNITGTVVQDFNKVITEIGSGQYDGTFTTASLDDGIYTIQLTPPASFPNLPNVPGYIGGFYHLDGVDNRVDTIAQADPLSIQGSSIGPIAITLQQGAGLNLRIFSLADDGVTYTGYNSVNVQVVADVGPNPATPIYATQLSSGANPDGMVRFTNLPAGSVRVYVFPPGSGAPSYVLTQLDGSTVVSIPLVQGQYAGTSTITGTSLVGYTDVVTRSAELIGTFTVNGPAANLSTTQIKAYRTDSSNTEVPVVFISPPTFNAVTGLYDFDAKVQAGTYRFKFIPPAPYLPQYFDTKYNFNDADQLLLNPDDKKRNVNVVFEQGGVFRVKVVDASTCDAAGNNCTPVQNAQLKIYTGTTAVNPLGSPINTGNDLTSSGIVTGIAISKPLTATNYFLQVNAGLGLTGQNYQTVWYSNQLNQATANAVQTQNGVVTNLTIKVALASSITGTVTRNGSLPPATTVTAYLLPLPAQLNQAISYQTTVNPLDGSYTLNIPKGNYIVGFNDNQDPIGYYANATNPNFATPVTATPLPGATGGINYNFQSLTCGFSGYSIGAATTTTVQISYQTDCAGDARVYYSLTPNFTPGANFAYVGAIVNSHDVPITGLTPNTTYYLKLTSTPQGAAVITYSTEVAVRTAADGKVWYFASGSTLSGTISSTVETLHLFNNDPSTSVPVTIIYYYTDNLGAAVAVTKSTSVPANQRMDIDVSTDASLGLVGVQAEHSTVVSVTSGSLPIMAERTIRTSHQDQNLYQSNGGYTIPGATGLSFEWWFANVNVFPDTDNYFSIYNPNVITACYSVYYYRNKLAASTDNTGPEAVTGKLVPPLSRVKFGVKEAGYTPTFSASPTNIRQFSVRVLSSNSACPANGQVVPLVVEQETYYGSEVAGRKGVAGQGGVPARQPNWIFSDGLVRGIDSQLYVFTNPSSATVVTLTYQLEKPQIGFNNIVTYTLPANSRFQIAITNPNSIEIGRSYGFSVKIDAAKPVAVERYATYQLQPQPNYDGLMSEPAFSRYSTRWQFAGGDTKEDSTGVNVSDLSYILTNPSLTQTVSVTFTYYSIGSSTPTVVSGIQVAPNTRLAIQANQVGSNYYGVGLNKVVAVQIDSTLQIAAERVYYWKYLSWIGGNAIFGYIPPNF